MATRTESKWKKFVGSSNLIKMLGLVVLALVAIGLYNQQQQKVVDSRESTNIVTPSSTPTVVVKNYEQEMEEMRREIKTLRMEKDNALKKNVVKVVEQPPADVVVKTETPIVVPEEYSLVPTKFNYGGTTTVADKNLSDLKIMWMAGPDKNVRFPYFVGTDGKSHIIHHTDGRSQPEFDPEPGHVWIPVKAIDMVPGPYREAYQKAPEAFWAIVPIAIATKEVAQTKSAQ